MIPMPSIVKRLSQVLCTCFLLTACHSIDGEIQKALDSASPQQQKRLTAFLEHYSNDKEALSAAKFIVANLENKYSVSQRNNTNYQAYIDSLDENRTSINSLKNYNYRNGVTSLKKSTSFQVKDIEILQPDLLIEQLDTAFHTWKQSCWSPQYSDQIFRKYVIPYRISNEPLEYGWRIDAYKQYKHWLQEYKDSSIVAACSYIYQNIDYQTNNLFWGEPLQSYSANAHYRRGTCSDHAVYTTMIMRALGIPTAIDFVPYWGDNNNGHSFNALILPDGTCKGYNNKEDLSSELHLSGKVSKVYRIEYEIQRNTSLYKYKDSEFIPPVFAEHTIADVTEYYNIPLANVTITPSLHTPKSHLVYLSVFSPKNWQPVAWSEYKKGEARFQNVGTGYTSHDSPATKGENYGEGGLFLPICYVDERLQPLTYPFILKEGGAVRYLKPEIKETEKIVLHRKHPRKSRIIEFARKMKGGYFELSNNRNFTQSDIAFFVDSIPESHIQRISLSEGKKYRYMRFYKRKGGISIGEIGCMDANGQVISGKILADIALEDDSELKNINDGNSLSYFDVSGLDDLWVGLDFGEPTSLSELFFCPRTDDNDIFPGDLYELFYWDTRWISLGKQSAQANRLVYNDVPKNALLWLRNLTKGHEERPFTYEEGKQIWW